MLCRVFWGGKTVNSQLFHVRKWTKIDLYYGTLLLGPLNLLWETRRVTETHTHQQYIFISFIFVVWNCEALKKKHVCRLEQVGKYRAAMSPCAVRVWYDNKRFALSYCVHPVLLKGYVEPGVSDKVRMGSKCLPWASFPFRPLSNRTPAPV